MLPFSLRLPYPVCTRFICDLLCPSPHKHRVCIVSLISLRLPHPLCTRFCFLCLCASPLKRRVCVVLLISLRLPCPVCTRFICHVLCASPRYRPFCAVLLSLVPLPFTQVCSFYQCVSPLKQCNSIFLGIFCSLMGLLAFTVIFSVSFTLSKLCVSEVLSFRSLPFNFVCFLCFVFLLRFIVFFPHCFPRDGFFVWWLFRCPSHCFAGFVSLCLQSSFASQTMAFCRAFLATSSLCFVFISPCCFQGILFCQLCRIF